MLEKVIRVGLIADTHMPFMGQHLPDTVFQIFDGVDMILHAGDHTKPYVINELLAIADVLSVAGNNDWFSYPSLPFKRLVKLNGFKIGMVHGTGTLQHIEQRVLSEFDAVDAIVFGHSHNPLIKKDTDILLINPGSPTDKRTAPYCSVGILEVGTELNAEIIPLPT